VWQLYLKSSNLNKAKAAETSSIIFNSQVLKIEVSLGKRKSVDHHTNNIYVQ
jgi:hypothetical protein